PNRPALPEDLPLVLLPDAGDRLDQRALACPVVADQRRHLADRNVQVDVGEGAYRAEVLAHADQAQQRLVAVAARGGGSFGGSLGEGRLGLPGGDLGVHGRGLGLGRGLLSLDGGGFGGCLAGFGGRLAADAGVAGRAGRLRLLGLAGLRRLAGLRSRRPARGSGPGVVRARIGHRARLLSFGQKLLITISPRSCTGPRTGRRTVAPPSRTCPR